jgi:hypothetical protein
MIYTFQDTIDHLVGYLGGDAGDQVQRDSREAALAAYNEIVNAYNWSYLYKQGRIKTIGVWPPSQIDPSQPVPTIQTFESGGTYPFQVTLTGATWPSWAGTGYIRVGLVDYKVNKMIDSVTLTLDPILSPVFDLPAGTQFALYYDTYLLPEDFISQDQAIYELNFGGMTFVHPRVWLFSTRYAFSWSQPQEFCVTSDSHYPGRLVMRVLPIPWESRTIDFIYKRRPRALTTPLLPLTTPGGTVSVSQGLNNLVGTGTAFTPNMVGMSLRLSYDSTAPTSIVKGTNPAAFDSIIDDFVSPTALTLHDAANANYAGVGWTASDPIEFEQGAMLQAYLRCCEKQIGILRILKDKPSASMQYDKALAEAKAADSRSFAGKSPHLGGGRPWRLRDYNQGFSAPGYQSDGIFGG